MDTPTAANPKGPVVVTGAAGYIGSCLVGTLLRRGYAVRATVRDPTNLKRLKPLLDLRPEQTSEARYVDDGRLSIWRGVLGEEGSFDDAVRGCTAVFHVATPMDFDSKDPQGEIIEPTVDGVLGIMRACKKEAATVRRVVFTSSAGTVNVQREQLSSYDESHWSDVDFISSVKMTGWAYFVSKIRAERAAREFAEENGMELISVIPPLVVGPFVSSTMPPSMVTALSPITGNSAHYSILKQIQLVHLHDLCDAHVFLLEHPHASSGRYICSSHDATIFQLATIIRDLYPRHYANVPTKFEGIEENIRHVHFSSQKLLSLGFKFQHSVEEMFRGAIDCCREKGFIPLYTTNIVDVEELDVRTYDEANRDVKDVNMQVAEEVEKKEDEERVMLTFPPEDREHPGILISTMI